MQVHNKKMYHYIKDNDYKKLWIVGNTIDNTKDFINDFTLRDFEDDYWGSLDGTHTNFYNILDYFKENLPNEETMKQLLDASSRYIYDLLLGRREDALEEIRRQYYPNLISRREAIWVCDESQIKTWNRLLPGERELLKVSITGEMFQTSADALPALGLSYEESLERAHDYWNVNLSHYDESSYEYLVKGKVKVLKKI